MRERLPPDRHAQLSGIGKVGQGHAPRLGRLSEDHVALGPVQGAPAADTPLKRPAHTVIREGFGIGQLKVPHQGDGLNDGIALEDRQQNRLPYRHEWIRHGAAPGRLALGGRARIALDPAGGAFAETRAGGSDTLAVIKTVSHVDSHLLVGDGFARHGRISVWLQRMRPYRPAAASTYSPKRAAPVAPVYGRATPSLRLGPPATLVDAVGQLCCRSSTAFQHDRFHYVGQAATLIASTPQINQTRVLPKV